MSEYFVSLPLAILFGFLSSSHCVGMCGGIGMALAMGIDKKVKQSRLRTFIILAVMSIGRIMSYAILGLVLGYLGQEFSNVFQQGYIYLQVTSFIILALMGLYLWGVTRWLAWLEKLGMPAWKKAQPLIKSLLPISNSVKAFSFGVLWGFLPCALVYSAAFYSLTVAEPLNAALLMFCFGLGTVPAIVSLSFFSQQAQSFANKSLIRKFAGSVVLVIVALLVQWNFQIIPINSENTLEHHHHH